MEIMKKTLMLSLYTALSAAMIAVCFLSQAFEPAWQIGFTVIISLTLIGLFLGKLLIKKIYKILVTIFTCEVIILGIYLILFYSGLLVHFTSIEATREWIESFGVWAWLMFFILQLLQVILLPIPAQVTTIAGVLILGQLATFVISSIAVILGSIIAFALGRVIGVTVAYKVAKKETVDKYRSILSKKGRILLPIMFLFPIFPDDLLCLIAGTTTMSWLYFIITTLITRLIGIACICMSVDLAEFIPFSGWGIPVWAVIIIALVTIAILLIKNQDKVESFVINLFTKNKKNNKLNEQKSEQTENLEETTPEQTDNENIENIENNKSKNKGNYVVFSKAKQKDTNTSKK